MSGTRRVTLGFKLVGSFGALLILAVGLGGLALATIRSLDGSLDYAVNSSAKKAGLVAAMRAGLTEMRVHAALAEISLLNNKLAGGALGMVSGAECASCHTSDRVATNRQTFEEVAARVQTQASDMRKFPLTPAESQALDTLASGVSRWQSLYQQYIALAGEKKFPQGHDIMVDQIYPLIATLEQAGETIVKEQRNSLGNLESDSVRSTTLVAAAVVLALIAGIGGLMLVRQVGRTMRQHSEDLLRMSDDVATTASEISHSNHALAESAAQQAASIEENSAVAAEIHGHTQQNAARTNSAAEIMTAEAAAASQVDLKLNEVLACTQEMVAASERISRIIRTIDEIAFQTNILALNAAVEAARAGEAGLSFSVVADEVRNLAHRSADAARDTAELVSSSVASSANASARLDEVTKLVRAMTERITALKRHIDEVNDSGQQQARGLNQIAGSMSQMEQLTAATVAQAEERTAASRHLSDQSAELRDVVAGLRELF